MGRVSILGEYRGPDMSVCVCVCESVCICVCVCVRSCVWGKCGVGWVSVCVCVQMCLFELRE